MDPYLSFDRFCPWSTYSSSNHVGPVMYHIHIVHTVCVGATVTVTKGGKNRRERKLLYIVIPFAWTRSTDLSPTAVVDVDVV